MLPSKERCPYLVVAEMLEQPFTSNSEEIYTQGESVLCKSISSDFQIVEEEEW